MFVNSNSNTRNVIPVPLPARAIGYIYRVSAAKGNTGQGDKLISLLKTVAPKQVVMEATLLQFALNYSDGGAVDLFAFSNVADANYFLRKQDNSWRVCWSSMGVINTCFATSQCLGTGVYFGFRNNNLAAPVNVHLEVVAMVDTTRQAIATTGYTITNGTNQGVNYLISADKLNWQRYSMMTGDVQHLDLNQTQLYIRVVNGLFNFVTYPIQAGRRYRIILNTMGKLDVIAD
ncbi:hypothetical protein BEL04_08460 [Mucilaginibacter sp. PPCGB 2223]|nr:hypothetical protein BEL04_08460 [Mucilaginibacter sp. PPCGB 2223]